MRPKLPAQLARLDRFCARLNSGLAAVAIVLAVVVVATATIRAGQYGPLAADPEQSVLLGGAVAND